MTNETRVVPVELVTRVAARLAATIPAGTFDKDLSELMNAMLSAAPPTADAQGDDARDGARWRKVCELLDKKVDGLLIEWVSVELYGPTTHYAESASFTADIDAAISQAHPLAAPGE